jgi:ABC-type transport system involved in Fe-S cluster assembly fused permease/ATPase subunit
MHSLLHMAQVSQLCFGIQYVNSLLGHMPWQEVGLWILYQFLASSAGIRLLQGYSEARVEQFAYRSVSVAAFDHVLSLSMDFHNSKDTGEVLKAVDQGYALQDLLNTAFKFAPTTIDLTVAVFYVTYLFDIYMTFILIVVMVLYSWAGVASIDWYVPCRRVYVSKDRDEAKIRNEVISNWTTMTLFGQNAYERQRFGAAITAVTDAALKLYLWLNMGSAVQQLTMELGLFAISLLGAYRVAQGERAVGDFITLVSYWGTVSGPISFFVHTIRNVSSNFIDAERLLQLFNTKPTVTDIPGALPLQVTSGKVAFENVSFGYDDRKSILKNINFTAEVGKTVAFVGETGGGKSSKLRQSRLRIIFVLLSVAILKLLFRLYDVGDGVITIDGQDIRRVTLQNLRSALGVVPQDPALFNQTIMENVRYGRLDASDEEVENACKAAAIHEKIMTFPDKYNTKVGERGVKLSGGELQRVALARVILRNPAVVILDEATSAVDSKTEASIQEELKKLSTGRTTMVVAHRLSTIKHADLILVIHDGQIVERGTHDELCALRGKYLQLWSKQASKSPSTGEEVTATIIEGETTSQLINV